MAKVVMVHGAGNALWGPGSIKAKWFPALADGLHWHGVTLDPDEVAVAFYGDLFRRDPERGYDPPVDVRRTLATVTQVVQGMDPHVDLDELAKALAEQHLDHLLAQAGAYVQDEGLRREARGRLERAVGPDTAVVVAHSLGTVVAYETLCAHPEWPVTDLVTLGSPLAGEVVFSLLQPAPSGARGAWPGSLAAWTNVRNDDDPACRSPFEGRFDGPVVDRAVDNGHRVHDPEPYLNNPVTGLAVATGLGRPSGGTPAAAGPGS